MDWKPVKHRLLGEIRVNIGSFKVGGEEEVRVDKIRLLPLSKTTH